MMKDGKIHQADSQTKVYNKPADAFVVNFLGSPNMIHQKYPLFHRTQQLPVTHRVKLLPENLIIP